MPPTKIKSKVVVTFLEEMPSSRLQKRPFGRLKGKIGIPDNFNKPLDDNKFLSTKKTETFLTGFY